MDSGLQLSVVIPTYNRAETLHRTLSHLADQDMDPSGFEAIVIDDASQDKTAEVVDRLAAGFPCELTYLRNEQNRGPGFTLNRGIRRSRAAILLLMPDDMLMSRGALSAHAAFHEQHPDWKTVALGKVVQCPELNKTVFMRTWDPFRFKELEDRQEVPFFRFWPGISCKREFMLRCGMYREHRGRVMALCFEDIELGYRLAMQGMRFLYVPEAWAYHDHEYTIDEAVDRWYKRGLNYGQFRRFVPDPGLDVFFHVLNWQTLGDHIRVLRGPNSFRGREASLGWHVLRHLVRMCVLNRLTARWVWRPILEEAERNKWLAALMRPNIYRAFLYSHFLRGVYDGRRRYGDTMKRPGSPPPAFDPAGSGAESGT